MFNIDIKYLRSKAVSILTDELMSLPESHQPQDVEIDALVRVLASLPKNPSADPRNSYIKLFPAGRSLKEYRLLAAHSIRAAFDIYEDRPVTEADAQFDDLLRTLLTLPARPSTRGVYEGYIKPEPKEVAEPIPVDVLFKDKRFVLTEEELREIVVDKSTYTKRRITLLLPHINVAMERFSITQNRLRVCHFLAQILHESGQLRYDTELASGEAYEGRKDLGNTQPGWGKLYKGRGLIQLTGYSNFYKLSSDLKIDFVNNPQLASSPEYSAMIAGWFWDRHKLNIYADKDLLKQITKKINGGYNGLADRERFLNRAKRVLEV